MKRVLPKSASTPTPQTTTPGSATPKARAPLALVEHSVAEPPHKSAMAQLGDALSKPPGSSWDEEPAPTVRLRKHVYQQLINLESMLMLHPDDEEEELLRIIKKPIEILRTRLSSTPVRARAAILHSLDHGAQTIPEFVTETRLTRADVVKHLAEMIEEKIIEKVPDGRTSNKQGPTQFLYIRYGEPTGDNYSGPGAASSSTAAFIKAMSD